MGTWGYAIKSDDLVLDVLDTFAQYVKHGATVSEATQRTRHAFAEVEGDPDEGPLLWIALAEAQWSYGEADPQVVQRVRSDIASGAGLDRWAEGSAADLAKRKRALDAFLAKVERPNPRPKKRARLVVRPPEFAAGDCLAVRDAEGAYRAAVVLAADHRDPEHGQNLIALLDYRSEVPPSMEVFEGREWARRRQVVAMEWGADGAFREEFDEVADAAWYPGRIGFKKERDRFTVVGQTRLRPEDPKEGEGWSFGYTAWQNLGR